jgi:hypothetical protein
MNYVPEKNSYVRVLLTQNLQIEGFVEHWDDAQVVIRTSSDDYMLLEPKHIYLTKIINQKNSNVSLRQPIAHQQGSADNDVVDDGAYEGVDFHFNEENEMRTLQEAAKKTAEKIQAISYAPIPQESKAKTLAKLKIEYNEIERKIIAKKLKNNNIDTSQNYSLPSFIKK